MSHEIQALKNRIKRTESDMIKLQSEFQALLDRMNELEKSVNHIESLNHGSIIFGPG
ncbi:MAG: hypothetical protein HQ541_16210 [Mariniphaga sp.]|nr:hypothetical protein [Mariniphaga sp.]